MEAIDQTAAGASGHADYPQFILVDLSTACNADCVMCPTQLNPLRKQLISEKVFDAIVEQVATFPSNIMFFIGVHGEPMLDKRLADKIALCRSRGLDRILLATNGSLLTEARARDILRAAPMTLMVSLESMDPATYESVRVGLRHEVIVENIKRAITVRDELDSPSIIGIRHIVSQRNAGELPAFRAFWEPYLNASRGDYISVERIHNWGYGDPTKFHGNTPCPHTMCSTILSDGSVVFCCLDHEGVYCLGNITETPLLDIFNSKRARELRAVHNAGQRHTLEMCKTCDVAEQWAGKPLDPLYDNFQAADWVRMPAGT